MADKNIRGNSIHRLNPGVRDCFVSHVFVRLCRFCVLALLVISASPVSLRTSTAQRNETLQVSEDSYRANNIGVALVEQFKFTEGAAQFRRSLRINPQLSLARLNLAIALYNARDLAGASRELRVASSLLPNSPQVHYLLALIARTQNRVPDAIASFQQVLKIDPRDPGTNINLGQLFTQQRKYAEAIAVLREAVAAEPFSVTATYSLAIALTRGGAAQEGAVMMKAFQALREKPYAIVLGINYLEQGKYAEALASTGAEPSLVDRTIPEVTFSDSTSKMVPRTSSSAAHVTAANPFGKTFRVGDLNPQARLQIASSLAGGSAPIDFDGDGDLDLLDVGPRGMTLYRNDAGVLVDVTDQSGLARSVFNALKAVPGDYDNDSRPDLFILGYGRLWLYHNEGGGRFADVTGAAAIPDYGHLALSAAFLDADHDGDLDIFIAGFLDLNAIPARDPNRSLIFPEDFPAAPNMLLRNQGNGKFIEITATAKVAVTGGRAVAVVPTDFDNHRDIDLLIVNYAGPPVLFSNQRDGTFRDVAAQVGLNVTGKFTSVAAGDLNKDGYTDFFFGSGDGSGHFAMSDTRGRFVTSSAQQGRQGRSAAQLLDFDSDGLLDLELVEGQRMSVLRNLGTRWDDVSDRAVSADLKSSNAQLTSLSSADFDSDGDHDLVLSLSTGGIKMARNDGPNQNRALKVLLVAKASNRSAVGAKVEALAGSLRQKLETYAAAPAPAPADIIFGLGKRAGADAVRVLWPVGIVQAETELARAKGSGLRAQSITITEIDRKPSSCPYLYTWNGERFEFVTDFMGGGEMGYWEGPGKYNHPDPDEYVRIRGDQLKARDGRFEVRITNELEEVVYLDRVQLIGVAHPEGTELYPNEGMTSPPRRFKLFTTRNPRPPVAARDDHGHDVLFEITKIDRRYPDDFIAHQIRGYAEEHSLTLDLGTASQTRTQLLLTGWTDYAFSSDNVAAHQRGLAMTPPRLEVRDSNGQWQTSIADIGIPVGRPQTIVVDLTGKFPAQNREVRIVTNMRIYWDEILVDASPAHQGVRLTRLEPATAELRWRGFSFEVTPDGREPLSYDYNRVSSTSPWKVMPGRYTREGDVRVLVSATDDTFVVAKPGDEISVSFDATRLGPPVRGLKRTFLLYADGFSKEMDINSASPDLVEPLPFHSMKTYPPAEHRLNRRREEYVKRYNTRVVVAPLPRIEASVSVARP